MINLCRDPANIPNLRWVAKLSNDETIWQNDINHENTSWLNLKQYVYENNLCVTHLHLEFRSHVIDVGDNLFAYYFNKGCRASFGGSQQCFVVAGIKNDDWGKDINTIWYCTPELEIVSENKKTIFEASKYLIINARI